MKSVSGRTAFITGGASGIGLGIAKAFYGAGANLVLADVREDRLVEAETEFADKARVLTVKLDVTDRPGFAAAAKRAEARFGKIHLLFNNAGIGVGGPLSKLGFDDWDWGLGVMIGGVVNGIMTLLPSIRKHGEGGHIVNTSSMAAIVPVNAFSIYGTAKAAVVGLSESIRGELAADNIGVSAFCPGPVRSNIRETGRMRPSQFRKDSGLIDVEEQLAQRPNSPLWMSPEECGERVLAGVLNNDLYIFTHPEFRPGAKAHFDAMLDAFPKEPVNEARAEAIEFLLHNPIYDRYKE